jgi:transcriptional regulator with PAS, ATPase and Fis domain
MYTDRFFNELDTAITVCDNEGVILFMNEKAIKTFEKYGGKNLIGKNIYDYHNPNSCEIIKRLLKEDKSNTYTITKNGAKKLIHQTPWHEDGKIMGLIEFSVELPADMQDHKR